MLPFPAWPDSPLAWGWLSLPALLAGSGLLALGLIVVALFPRRVQVAATTLAAAPLTSLGLGCLIYVVALALSPLLLCALPLLWGVLALAGLFGLVAAGIWVGERVLHTLDLRAVDTLRAALVGLLAIWLVALVPLLGWAAFAAAAAAGLGATITSRLGGRPRAWPREEPAAPPAPAAAADLGGHAAGRPAGKAEPGER